MFDFQSETIRSARAIAVTPLGIAERVQSLIPKWLYPSNSSIITNSLVARITTLSILLITGRPVIPHEDFSVKRSCGEIIHTNGGTVGIGVEVGLLVVRLRPTKPVQARVSSTILHVLRPTRYYPFVGPKRINCRFPGLVVSSLRRSFIT